MNVKEAIKLLKENKYIVERNEKVFFNNVQDEMDLSKAKPEGLSAENPITDPEKAYDKITNIFIKDQKLTVICYCNAGFKDKEDWATFMKDKDNDLYLALTTQGYDALVKRLNILFHAKTFPHLSYHTKGHRYDFFLVAKDGEGFDDEDEKQE